MKTQTPRALAAAFAAGLLLAAAPSRAADPAAQAAAAALFQEAKQLVAAGDYARACPKFAEAQRLFPTVGTLLNLGDCYEKLGKLASARGAFAEAEVAARNANDTEREQEAIRRGAALAPQLAKLAIVVPPAARVPGFELRRDGIVVGEGQWATPLPLDVGLHKIEATAPGRKPWSTVMRIETNGTSASIEVPVLDVAPAVGGGTAVPSGWGPQRMAGVTIAAAAVVPLVVGGVFAAKAAAKNSDSLPHCLPNDVTKCDATGVSLRNEAFNAAHVSTGTFVAGGIMAAAGIVIAVTAPSATAKKDDKGAGQVQARPTLGPGFAGLTLQGAW
jgi:serine/threonine-protein kinase